MIEDFSGDWRAWSYRGGVYSRLCRYDEAIENYRKSIELQTAPRLIDDYECIAQISMIRNDYGTAVDCYERILNILREDWHITEGTAIDRYSEWIAKYQDGGR